MSEVPLYLGWTAVGEFDGADASRAEGRDDVIRKGVRLPVLPTPLEGSEGRNAQFKNNYFT